MRCPVLPTAPFLLLLLAAPARAQGSFVQCTRVLHTFEGEAAGDQFGWVSAPLADLDGDGAGDLVVGAPFHDAGGSNAGRIYVYGGRSGLELFHADGGHAGESLGHAVRAAGDLDGDGVGDVLAGGKGTAQAFGAARVYSGAGGGLLLSMQLGLPADAFGYSVAGLGDVDGDGVPDFAVGAPLEDSGGTDAGRVYVISGANGFQVLHSFLGEAPGDTFGTAVARLGDVTGDGVPELAVGAANAGVGQGGRAYVFDLVADALLYPPLLPDGSAAEFGQFFVDDVGRVDADPWPDLYVGDFADGNGRGKAYVFSGATGQRVLTLTGRTGEGFGIGRGLGDVNGDGRADLLLGSWTAGGTNAGKLEVLSGLDGSLLRRVTSRTARENLGFDAHGLDDQDGDGVPELVGTAASFQMGRGRVYVIAARPLEPIGAGLAGSGGLVPTLAFGGCPTLGSSGTLDTAGALGGAPGALFVGRRRVDRPFLGGVFHPGPEAWLHLHMADGTPGAAGAGSSSYAFGLPTDPSLVGVRFTAQAAYADPGALHGVSLTAGLTITLY